MTAPRWIFVALLLTLSSEMCSSSRPLTLDGVIKDGDLGTECANNNCGNCNHPAGCFIPPPDIVEPTPCEPPHNCEPLPPPPHREPSCLPLPPIIVEPPFICPVVEPCPRCDICVDYSKMDAAMAPVPAS